MCRYFRAQKMAAKLRTSCAGFWVSISLLVYQGFDSADCIVRMAIVFPTCWKDVHYRHVEEFHQKEPNRWRAIPLEGVLCWRMGHMSGPPLRSDVFFGERFFCE